MESLPFLFAADNWEVNLLQCEEPRVICGTRGVPGTVAPFRAWRGSRDLVAQSPKFHAPAVAPDFMWLVRATAEQKFSTASRTRPKLRPPLFDAAEIDSTFSL